MLRFMLGVVLLLGFARSVSADFQEALEAYRNGDYESAFEEFKTLAKRGNPSAQYNLAIMYHQGQGSKKDLDKAMDWFRRAADQGYASAQFKLGIMYGRGEGVSQDYTQAAEWFHKAADNGIVKALTILGTIYHEGEGVPQDNIEAFKWFYIAATKLPPGNLRDISRESLRFLDDFLTEEEIDRARDMARAWTPIQ